MPDASVPAIPMCGMEQVVFRLQLDANSDGQTREGKVLLIFSTPWEAVPGSGVSCVGQFGHCGGLGTHQTAQGQTCSVEMPPD